MNQGALDTAERERLLLLTTIDGRIAVIVPKSVGTPGEPPAELMATIGRALKAAGVGVTHGNPPRSDNRRKSLSQTLRETVLNDPSLLNPAARGAKEHPAIQALFRILPSPGEAWDAEQRDTWLLAMEAIFSLVYKEPSPDAGDDTEALDPDA